ncbi:RNA polymerase sigma-70 factor [Pedobacter sp.]|uniref:RNA polymerase sigma factor n=1 Tax=Pedobacter sp. TaxID=1411316 RepID=UPI002CFE1037|nr:RNA polymerase sigma-70 factor [Pedobacter sp.]HWW40706.1 RNA polymerase sigma-70 factor [Pedobacter sp.]
MLSLSEKTDQELLLLLQLGERSAYEEIYRRYWPLLFRHARKLLQNDEASKDVVQDTFIHLWATSIDLDIKTALSPYLYASVRNQILNIFRHNKVQANHLKNLGDFINQGANITDHLVREKILAKLIEDEISNLPPRMREVFELKRKAGLSYKEIAGVMNISELTVKTQMNKAITILRAKFGNSLSVFLPFL